MKDSVRSASAGYHLSCGMDEEMKYEVWREGDWFIAKCSDFELASQGRTHYEAVQNLREALDLYNTPPVATIRPML